MRYVKLSKMVMEVAFEMKCIANLKKQLENDTHQSIIKRINQSMQERINPLLIYDMYQLINNSYQLITQ